MHYARPLVLTFVGLVGGLSYCVWGVERTAASREVGIQQGKVALEQKGYLVAPSQCEVWPKVSGQIVELAANVEEGKLVKKGELLARLDPIPYEIAHGRAKAALKRAEARLAELKNGPRPEEVQLAKLSLAQAEEQRKQQQAEADRMQKLREGRVIAEEEIERAKGRTRMAELEIEKARAALEPLVKGTRKEQVDAAEAEVEMARADLDLAAYRLAGTRIVAPISGTLLFKRADIGAVKPNSDSPGLGFFTIADLSNLEVELDVQERDIQAIFVGQKCDIQAEAFPKALYPGKVSRLMPNANRAKGAITVRVKIEIPKGDDKLRPEMGVLVSFFAKE